MVSNRERVARGLDTTAGASSHSSRRRWRHMFRQGWSGPTILKVLDDSRGASAATRSTRQGTSSASCEP